MGLRLLHSLVFPAYAGVFLDFCSIFGGFLCLPRIRGGVSRICGDLSFMFWSSPHTRGCFSIDPPAVVIVQVFPAYAGVFLLSVYDLIVKAGLPRIRGGVSQY